MFLQDFWNTGGCSLRCEVPWNAVQVGPQRSKIKSEGPNRMISSWNYSNLEEQKQGQISGVQIGWQEHSYIIPGGA